MMSLELKEGKCLWTVNFKELNIEDKKRGRYYNYYTGKEWGDLQIII
mgnify:CR=1 FL=1